MSSRSNRESAAGEGDAAYTERLATRSGAWWKKAIGAQLPYRWNLRRIAEGVTLDIGCGIGRNLDHLDGDGVGVDVNPHSVELARERGLIAYTSEDFEDSPHASTESYGTLLFAHVLEHMDLDEATALVGTYLRFLTPGGLVVVIVPQEAGFASDPTHVAPLGHAEISQVARDCRLGIEKVYSFPFPSWAGRFFRHNETVALMRKPTGPGQA